MRRLMLGLGILLINCTNSIGQCIGWENYGPMPARFSHAAAYVPTTEEIMFYRGLNRNTSLSDSGVWLYHTGTGAWQFDLGTTPSGHFDTAVCWDDANGRVVQFGSTQSLATASWTYGWDPASRRWEVLSTEGPSARRGHAMAFDGSAGKVVLFGGTDEKSDELLGDTWEWNGQEWTQRSNIPEIARTEHAMAFDPERGSIVMFGGRDPGLKNDTWQWSDEFGTWLPVAFVGPAPRSGHAMSFEPIEQGILMFGGDTNDSFPYLSDTWFLGSDRSFWVDVSTVPRPSPRTNAVMVTHGSEGHIYLNGGTANNDYGDLWKWSGSAVGWEPVTRYGNGMPSGDRGKIAADPVTGSIFLFGGLADLGRIWRWNLNTHAWDLLDALGPSARQWHTFVLDERTGNIVLHGGTSTGPPLGDTWTFDPVSETWTEIFTNPAPGPREQAAMTFDPVSQRVILYGGLSPSVSSPLSDTWAWDGMTQEWTRIANDAPGGQRGPAIGFDRKTEELILCKYDTIFRWDRMNQLWMETDEYVWNIGRTNPAMVYSHRFGSLVLSGGRRGQNWMNHMVVRNRETGDWDSIQPVANNTSNAQWPSLIELPADNSLMMAALRTYVFDCEDAYYCPPDVNNDRQLDFFDVAQYLAWFAAQDERADLVGLDFVFDFFDVSVFLSSFSEGCP